jgi:hypothetical protein
VLLSPKLFRFASEGFCRSKILCKLEKRFANKDSVGTLRFWSHRRLFHEFR